MAKLSSLAQDLDKERDGVWVEWEGMRFKVARMGNPASKEFAQSQDDEDQGENKRAVKLMARVLLKDWADVEREDGTVWRFSPEEAENVLGNPAFSDLFDFLGRESMRRANFLREPAQK